MKRTNWRMIKLPKLIEPGSELARKLGLDEEGVKELNLRSYDYGRRTAIPTLACYITDPFSETVKEIAFNEAVKAVGLDSEGIIRESYSFDKIVLNGKIFFVKVYPYTRIAYENVLSKFKDFLDGVVGDFVPVGCLLVEMERLKDGNSTTSNKRDLAMKDPATNKKLNVDEGIEEMCVYFDAERFAHVSPENADDFYKAMSLDGRIKLFSKEFEERTLKRHGIKPFGLGKSQSVDYELSDGSAVRILFYSLPSTEYGQIYSELARKTTKATRDTGDLNILEKLAFKGTYEDTKGGEGIIVNTVTDDINLKAGKVTILRRYKDGTQEERTYITFDSDGRIRVKTEDMFKALRELSKKYTKPPEKTPTQIKIDFFAALPTYLI